MGKKKSRVQHRGRFSTPSPFDTTSGNEEDEDLSRETVGGKSLEVADLSDEMTENSAPHDAEQDEFSPQRDLSEETAAPLQLSLFDLF